MEDKEIKQRLQLADGLLAQYVDIVKPVAEELAKRKGEVVDKKYTGDLGCWEEGIDTICLHLANGQEKPSTNEWSWLDAEEELRNTFFDGIVHINLRGHW